MKLSDKFVSIVLPVFNEAAIIEALISRLEQVANTHFPNYEILFVDDGSRDETFNLLESYNRKNPRVKVIRFSRNFGHQTAISAGLSMAGGDCVIIMDADLQDPPEFLPRFIEAWQEGYQVVYAIRTKRKENFLKRASYAFFYRLLQKLADIDIPLDSGDFCLMDRRVVDEIRNMPERNRFVRGLRSWVGFRQIGVEYERDKRQLGEAKYTLAKLFKLALDGFFSFSQIPLRLATFLGFIASGLSFIGGLIVIALRVATNYTPQGWTSTIVVVFFLGGVQLITIGIIGEYVGRIYDEVKQRPNFVIDKRVGI